MKPFRKIKNDIFPYWEDFTIPIMVASASNEFIYKNSLAFSDMKSSRFRKLFDRHEIISRG